MSGRKKLEAPASTEDRADTPALGAALAIVRSAAPELRAQEDLALFELGQQVGAIQMGRLQASVVAAATLRLFEQIKESNKFKDLPLQRPDGRVAAATNLREFCELVFGVGYQRMLEAGQTLEVLGEDAYEAAQRLRLNRSQMRLIRALPAPQQEQIKVAIAGGSRDEVVAVIEDLAAGLAEAREKVEELRAEAKATQQVLDKKNARIDKLERERVRFAKQPPDEQLKSMLDEANRVRLEALAAISGQLRMAVVQIQEHCASHANDRAAQDVVLAGMLGSLTKALADLREEAQLPDVSSAADQQLAAEVAEWGKQS